MDMNINLNIVATELCEAVNNLASAILGMGSNSVGAAEQAQPATRKPRANKTVEVVATTETVQEVVQAEILPELAVVEKVAEAIKAEEVVTPGPVEKVFTLEEVRAKLTELSAAGKQQQIKDLFVCFGAKKLTEVKAEDYAALMAAAEEIG